LVLERPEDIANAVVFFASKQADWITGQVLFVHGGHRMAFGQQGQISFVEWKSILMTRSPENSP